MEKYTPLHTLRARVTDEVICVRVSRLWLHRGGTDRGPTKEIHMVLLDSQGDALHAVVPAGFVNTFIQVLCEKNVYELSKFLLAKKLKFLRPIDSPFAITFNRSTVVKPRADLNGTLPQWFYSLTPLSCLPAPSDDPGCLVDVLGKISSVSDIKLFDIPHTRDTLLKCHVYLRDLGGHEIKIVLWGNCALRFKGDKIRALGQSEPAVAIFVGTTAQQYDGSRGLAGGAACSWYINEDIVDINMFRTSSLNIFQPIAHAPEPHVLSLRTQVGEDWPTKQIAQLAVFNLFENKEAKFRCTVRITGIRSRQQWWYAGCRVCNRMARPNGYAHADPHSYICIDRLCPSTEADIMYSLSVIGSDQTGEAEFTMFGHLAEQIVRKRIHRVIMNNQPSEAPITNLALAAWQVRFPPPEITRILGTKCKFVVCVSEGSFRKSYPSFLVREVEASYPSARRLSSADTVIPATSWDIDCPAPV